MAETPDYARARQVDFNEIPILDANALDPAQLLKIAQQVGFFYLNGHGISDNRIEAAFTAAENFFAQPETDKAQIAVDTDQRGWMAQGMTTLEGSATHDAKEVFFWGWETAPFDPDIDLPMVAVNRWPPGLRAPVMSYYFEVVDLGRKVLSALAEGLGKSPDFFEPAYEKPLARGQLVYYPPVDEDDLAAQRFSAAEHTDFGVLTMLMQDDTGGLQVKNRAGDWIDAPPIPGTFVCNIGDLLEHWTGGQLVSTPHRVINMSGQARFSIPIFCDPGSATLIDPADFGGQGDAITAGDYIAGKNRRNFTQYENTP